MSAEAWIALAALVVTILGALLGSSFALIWKVSQVVHSINGLTESIDKLGLADVEHIEEQKRIWGAVRQGEKRGDRHHLRLVRIETETGLGPMQVEASG